ncbi:MAG: hypothetical protein PHO41_09245 [Eubacteriales bacterium]|nr:hypothetical protein [Eubacteriales bacterium]
MAVTVTVGTNSYISVADATTYLDNNLYITEWTAASADDKSRAVIMATRKIDRLTLTGAKKLATQALEFPRAYVYDTRYTSDNQTIAALTDEGWYTETDVPQAVLDAVCEEALALLQSGNDSRRKLQRAGVKSYSLGSLSETFADSAIAGKSKGLLSDEAKALMKPYIAGAVRII